MQARDVMTKTLINCSPEANVYEAVQLMRNGNTGDVLVTDEGKLVGIVTDRDIAVHVTAKSLDLDQVLVRDVMSTRVRTGEPSWDLNKIAKEMGKYQIRRLPIAENGVPVGIVSLSDIALHNAHKSHVAKSLKEISESRGTHRLHSVERNMLRVTLGLGLLATAVVVHKLYPKLSGELREQFQASRIGDRLLGVVQAGRDKMAAAVNKS